MARYIDANKAEELIKNYGKAAISDGLKTLDTVDDIVMLAKGIDLIPTADVVEIVRCNDCAVPHNEWTGCPRLNGLIPPPDFYCAYGQRKEG